MGHKTQYNCNIINYYDGALPHQPRCCGPIVHLSTYNHNNNQDWVIEMTHKMRYVVFSQKRHANNRMEILESCNSLIIMFRGVYLLLIILNTIQQPPCCTPRLVFAVWVPHIIQPIASRRVRRDNELEMSCLCQHGYCCSWRCVLHVTCGHLFSIR